MGLLGIGNLDKAQSVFDDYVKERSFYFWTHFNSVDAIQDWFGYIVITIIEIPGKFTATSPIFTALIPEALILDAILIQLLFNLFYNDFFAGGNILLISIQLFTFV